MRTAIYDAVVSGLVLNFIPELTLSMAEMVRVTKPGGTVAAYVWDYAGKMELMRYFWDAAVTLKPEARERDEGRCFPLCQPILKDRWAITRTHLDPYAKFSFLLSR
jgi:hypothetical protein